MKQILVIGIKKLESGFGVEFETLLRKELEPFHEYHLGVLARMFVEEEDKAEKKLAKSKRRYSWAQPLIEDLLNELD